MAWLFIQSNSVIGYPNLPFYCPTCQRKVHHWLPYQPGAAKGKPDLRAGGVLCPHCGSLERTRLFSLYFEDTKLPHSKPRMLHFAPERKVTTRLRNAIGSNYVTTDLFMKGVDQKEDITEMTFDNDSFDFIFCSHVLEHVEQDASAMAELYRVLAPGGTAIIHVPIKGEKTYENPSIVDPAERVKHFGQFDHVRYYGADIAARLENVGFLVFPFHMVDVLRISEQDKKKMNLGHTTLMHKCVKPAP
jgi:SAM-dependent methyltransferase